MKTQKEIEKEIIEETLKEFVEKHELNLKNIGGWDKNDFLDYSRQLLEKALKSKQKDVLKILDDKELLEKLADLEHKQWLHLIEFFKDYNNSEGDIMDKINSYEERGLLTEYKYLLDKDKEKDREWARDVIEELKKRIEQK